MKITKFNPIVCKTVSARVEAALKTLADELGVQIKAAGGSYTDGDYTLKLKVSTIAEDGSVNTREADAFRQLASLYGLKPDDLGREFQCGGRTFKIAGLKTRARTQPILCLSGGSMYKFRAEDVAKYLAASC